MFEAFGAHDSLHAHQEEQQSGGGQRRSIAFPLALSNSNVASTNCPAEVSSS